MALVGIRELKNRLSYYLGRVKHGYTVQVAERGHEIALIIPLPHDAEQTAVWRLVRTGQASWSGDKPRGFRRKISLHGPSLAQTIVEDRR